MPVTPPPPSIKKTQAGSETQGVKREDLKSPTTNIVLLITTIALSAIGFLIKNRNLMIWPPVALAGYFLFNAAKGDSGLGPLVRAVLTFLALKSLFSDKEPTKGRQSVRTSVVRREVHVRKATRKLPPSRIPISGDMKGLTQLDRLRGKLLTLERKFENKGPDGLTPTERKNQAEPRNSYDYKQDGHLD